MKKYSFPKRLPFLILLIISLYGCKKSVADTSNNPPPSNGELLKTPIGTPVGDPVTATVGVDGGKLISDDGTMELTIPSGALAGDKAVSIQRVSNEIPGGIGFAYDLLPNGTVFKKPAKILFHFKK